jgi:hypothetical protein
VRVIANLGIAAIMGALVSASPLVLAGFYVFRPSERLLALMRPLTLASVFAAVANTVLGLVNSLVYVSRQAEPVSINVLAAGLAESLVVAFLSFGCLSAAWLAVAVGMRRQV